MLNSQTKTATVRKRLLISASLVALAVSTLPVVAYGDDTVSSNAINYNWSDGNLSVLQGVTISGSSTGLYALGNVGTLSNSGVIDGTKYGILTSDSTTYITAIINNGTLTSLLDAGNSVAVYNSGTIGTILNSGLIQGSYEAIRNLGTISTLTNSGTVVGRLYGIHNYYTVGTLVNTGTLSGDVAAIYNAGFIGSISNSGTIQSTEKAINNTGTISTLINEGLLSGENFAVYNLGSLATISNSHVIAGDIYTLGDLVITGATDGSYGVLAGYTGLGVITAANLTFASGNLWLKDNVFVNNGTGTVTNSGATLLLSGEIDITGHYTQTSGILELGTDGKLVVQGTASVTGGTITASMDAAGNYIARNCRTLISAVSSSDYTGLNTTYTLPAGMVGTIDRQLGDLVIVYLNDYVGGTLTTINNADTLSGTGTMVYVASTGSLGTLTNTGIISGGTYAIYNAGTIGLINNSGLISGNIYSAGNLTIAGSSSGLYGMLTGASDGMGTITASGVTFSTGYILLNDTISVGSGTVLNSGATLQLADTVTISGNYSQTGGSLIVNASDKLVVSGDANLTGSDIVFKTISGENYIAGESSSVLSAGTLTATNLNIYSGSLALTSTVTGTDIIVTYASDYIGGTLASLSNAGTINAGTVSALSVSASGSLGSFENTGLMTADVTGIHIRGAVGTLTNSGAINMTSASSHALGIYNRGTIGTLTNGGTVSVSAMSTAIGGFNTDLIGTLTNTGTFSVTSTNSAASGIINGRAIDTLTTSGTIMVSADIMAVGIVNSGYISSLSNSGTITVTGSITAYGVMNGSSITSLNNSGIIAATGDVSSVDVVGVFNAGLTDAFYNSGTIRGDSVGIVNGIYGTVSTSGASIAASIGTLTNTGTISGGNYAVYNTGTIGLITNSGLVAGNIYSESDLTIAGATGVAYGTLTGYSGVGTITSSGVTFTSGNLLLNDNVTVGSGSGTVANSGATLALATTLTITGNYTQTSGVLEVGTNELVVSGIASITGGTIVATTVASTSGNYTTGSSVTLVDGATGSDYAGATVRLSNSNVSYSTSTTSDGDLVLSYLSDYIGGTLSSLTNSGTITEVATAVYVAGTLGTLTNTGTLSGSVSGVSVLGDLGGIDNTGTISDVEISGTVGGSTDAAIVNSGLISLIGNTGTIATSGATYGIQNSGTIATLTNSGTITGSHYDIYNTGTIGTLTNNVHIGSDYAVYNAAGGTLTSLNNTGTITGTIAAIYNAGVMGLITNSGLIDGNIISTNALTIAGATGASFGTLSGGTITATGVTFTSGNIELSDAINVGSSGTVSVTGATLALSTIVSVTGNYSQTGGSLISTVTSSSVYGGLAVSGSATVTNTTITITGTGYTAGQTLTIVDAGAASSYTSDTVTVGGLYTASLATVGNDLMVTISSATSFAQIGSTVSPAAASVGGLLDRSSTLSTLANTLSAYDTAGIEKGLKQLAPAEVGSTAALLSRAQLIGDAVGSAIDARMSDTASVGLWNQALGGYAHRGATASAQAYNMAFWGLALGGDTRIGESWRVGGAFSYAHGWNDGTGDLTGTGNKVDSYQLTGYAGWQSGNWHALGRAAIGYDAYSQHRGIDFLSAKAKADYDGHHYDLTAESGYDIRLGDFTLTPRVSLDWLRLGVGSYSENGAGDANMAVASHFDDQFTSTAGLKVNWLWQSPWGTLAPELLAGWSHDYINERTWTEAALGGNWFTSRVGRVAPDAAKIGAHVNLTGTDGIRLDLGYDGQFRSGYTAHTGYIRMHVAL